MNYPKISYPKEKALELSRFREMDYYAVNSHNLPVELMMENAGYHLARLAAPKKILYRLPKNTALYVADLDIPKEVYKKFGVSMLPFNTGGIIKLIT